MVIVWQSWLHGERKFFVKEITAISAAAEGPLARVAR